MSSSRVAIINLIIMKPLIFIFFFLINPPPPEFYPLPLPAPLPFKACRTERQHLPQRLPRSGQVVQERTRRRSQIADAIGRRQRRRVQQYPTAAAIKQHWHQKPGQDRKSTRLNSSHLVISYAVFCLK